MSVSDYITNYKYKIGKLKDFVYIGNDSILNEISIKDNVAHIKSRI